MNVKRTVPLSGLRACALAASLIWAGVAAAQVPAYPTPGAPGLQGPPGGGPPPGGPPAGAPPGAPPGGPPGGLSPAEGGGPSDELREYLKMQLYPPLPPDAPKPSPNLRDFRGTWSYVDDPLQNFTTTMFGRKVPVTPRAKEIIERRIKADKAGQPYASASDKCLEPGQMWMLVLGFPFQIYEYKNVMYVFFQEFHSVWKIRMNQKHRPANERETMGDSIGYWDGNTLVVETTNYAHPLWLDISGTPTTKDLKMTHRIRRIDEEAPALEIVTSFEDPAMYKSKWSVVRKYEWRPDKEYFDEYNCERQAGSADALDRYGAIEEAQQ